MTHLTLDQLSAHLDGALEDASFDLVRHHLEWCEPCRAQGLRVASANDVLTALLTHDPDDQFFEALEGFLEDQFNAKVAAYWIPPELDRLIAAEIARLEAHRWAAVSEAITPAPVGPSGATPATAGAPRAAHPAPPEPSVPAVVPAAAGSRPVGGVIPAHFVRPLAQRKAPVASMAPPPVSPPKTAPASHDGAVRLIGAALVALVLLMAGLYFSTWTSRARVAGSYVSTGAGPTRPAPATPVSPGSSKTVRPAGPPGGVATDGSPEPGAKEPAATIARETPAASVRSAPVTPAVAPPVVPASKPAVVSAGKRPAAPSAAPERGLLCGQVRDESGKPIVRAQVLLADVQVGAMTDRHGRFCISVPIGSRTVSVIALGFTTRRRIVTIGRKTPELAFTLRSAAVQESPGARRP